MESTMKLRDEATIAIVAIAAIILAVDFYAAATDSSSSVQNDAIPKSPVTSSTSTESTETTDNPEIRIDIRSAAWIILALVIGTPIGVGIYKNLDALAGRLKSREKQQKTD